MPQKLNKAGKMQDYIPKGNGDASGEYGTSNGTNKNFTTSDKKSSKANVITENKSVVVENKGKKEKVELSERKGEPIKTPLLKANKIEDVNQLEMEETTNYYTKDNWEEAIGKQMKPKQRQAIKNIIDNIEKEVGGIGDDKYILKDLEIEFVQDEETRKKHKELGLHTSEDVRVTFKLELDSVKDHPMLIMFNKGISFNVGEQGGYYTYNKNYNKKPLTSTDIKWMNYYDDWK